MRQVVRGGEGLLAGLSLGFELAVDKHLERAGGTGPTAFTPRTMFRQ